jgi:hypothetical protein
MSFERRTTNLTFHCIFCTTMGSTKEPKDFLASVIGSKVKVRLNSSIEYRGIIVFIKEIHGHRIAYVPGWIHGIDL